MEPELLLIADIDDLKREITRQGASDLSMGLFGTQCLVTGLEMCGHFPPIPEKFIPFPFQGQRILAAWLVNGDMPLRPDNEIREGTAQDACYKSPKNFRKREHAADHWDLKDL